MRDVRHALCRGRRQRRDQRSPSGSTCANRDRERSMNPNRSNTKKEKELADNARLLRAWKKFHREEREAVLAGPYGTALTELFRMFANMKHVRPSQLVGYMRAIEWSEIDYPTRLTVLHEANAAITKLREQQGLSPIDDALPGEPLRAFQLIRNIMNQFPAQAGKTAGTSGKSHSDEE